jgi:peptide/nickel transport system substrate-binding protein
MILGPKRALAAAVAIALALFASACGDDGANGSVPRNAAEVASTATGSPQPVRGGTLTFGTFSEAQSVDPVKNTGSGTTGNTELGAVYDTLVRYNPESRRFEMRTAESVEPNADQTVWTVKLRPNIKFGDGTAYDSAALKLSIDRHQAPSNLTNTRALTAIIKSSEVVDALTVRVTLTEPWTAFPYVLGDRVGMLVSPTALQKYGADFGTPTAFVGAGAGAFEIESYKPKEALTLKRRTGYWGGDAYLDGIRFINIPGGDQTLAAFETGTVQMAFLREPPAVAKALDAGYPNFTNSVQTGSMIGFKNTAAYTCAAGKPEPTCTGRPDGVVRVPSPTSDLKLRQAITAAIDPKVFDDRVYSGKSEESLALLQPSFPWDPGVAGPKTDTALATRLVTELKAAGWNGKLKLTCSNTPEYTRFAQSISTMLQAVGIEVENNSGHDLPTQIREVSVTKNFDLTCFSLNIPSDEGAVIPLATAFGSTGSLRWGYSSTAMDDAIRTVRRAATDDEKRAAWRKVAEVWNADQPGVPLGTIREAVIWKKNVHGVVPTQQTFMLLDKAWIER